jgi:hypothetical protein
MALPLVCMHRGFISLVRIARAMMDIGPPRERRWCVCSLPKPPRLHLGWVDHPIIAGHSTCFGSRCVFARVGAGEEDFPG